MPRRILNRLPLRTRLTLWVVAIAVVMQAAVGGVFFLYQQQAVNGFFDGQLKTAGRAMAESMRGLMPDLDVAELRAVADRGTKNALFSGFVMSVYDASGTELVTMRTKPPQNAVTAEEIIALANNGRTLTRRYRASEVKRYEPGATMARGVYQPFHAVDGKRYVLAAWTSDTAAEQMLSLVLHAVVAAFVPGLVVAGLCGWVIAGLAVRPIREVSLAARRLGPESIDRAMPLTGNSPEVERLQRDLENARQRLASAFAAQERFMSNVSHELKTPIAVLLTEAQTLRTRDASRDVKEFVSSMTDELRRLGAMVDSFLLLTRVRDGRSVVRDTKHLINEMLMESVTHCKPMAAPYEVKLLPLLCETNVELRVRGDPSLLRTMLDNLVRNAIRFSPRGGAIEIAALEMGNLAVLRVRDRGPGIPDALIDRVFDRFVQAPEEHRRGRGHGLGLEIAQGIAELHGGRITARNLRGPAATTGEPGPIQGCEFEVRLPRVIEDISDQPSPPSDDEKAVNNRSETK